jgi:hypothetical protein
VRVDEGVMISKESYNGSSGFKREKKDPADQSMIFVRYW